MPGNPARPPRFPSIAALLCVACVGAAAWTWMRYSYAWDVTPGDVAAAGGVVRERPFVGCYVVLRGYLRPEDWKRSYYVYTTAHGGDRVVVDRASSGVPVGPGPVGRAGRSASAKRSGCPSRLKPCGRSGGRKRRSTCAPGGRRPSWALLPCRHRIPSPTSISRTRISLYVGAIGYRPERRPRSG
jgi:hypothetical protein